jgi:hypothetical protein
VHRIAGGTNNLKLLVSHRIEVQGHRFSRNPHLRILSQTLQSIETARRGGRLTSAFIVTAEEHSILGGLGEAVAAVLSEFFPTLVRRVGVRDVFGESGTAQVLDRYGLRAANIMEEALELMKTPFRSRQN